MEAHFTRATGMFHKLNIGDLEPSYTYRKAIIVKIIKIKMSY